MLKARLVWGTAASFAFAWGALAALEACSSTDSGTSSGAVVTPTVDGGGSAKDANPGDTSTPQQDAAAGDAGSDCGTPAKLFPPKPDGGVFCPFSAPAGGKNVYCTDTQQCCENAKGQGVSTCVAKGTACPVQGATAWECEDPSNCAAGQKCCAHSGDAGAVTIATDTCGPYLSKFSGTRCAATCGAGELVVCEQQSECTSGTCTAVKPKGNDIGVCK
jgi:hypothetical protein